MTTPSATGRPATAPAAEAPQLTRVTPSDLGDLHDFLVLADLTLAQLDAPEVRLWIERDAEGAVIGSTGFELSTDGACALIRSVAVHPDARGRGFGTALARFALAEAARAGATQAWLFSRRSGPFWQSLGFAAASVDELASVFADAHQVRHFVESGRLAIEVAWSMPLAAAS